jgi:hypothetical protein
LIDRLHINPDRLFLTPAAADGKCTIKWFLRWSHVKGSEPKRSLVLSLVIDRYRIVRIVCHRLEDGRWWVRRIEANLPALVHGHNGRPLTTVCDVALALTRLAFIVSLAVNAEGHGRIIPGVGANNQGHLAFVECMIQFCDTQQQFLYASHTGRLRNQQQPTGVYFGESSKFSKREIGLSIYDKCRQLRSGTVFPAGAEATRVEAIIKNPVRLAKDAAATQAFSGAQGPLVATLSPSTAYAILRLNLESLSGFGWLADCDSLSKLTKTASLIIAGLGNSITDSHRIELALENYRRIQQPGIRQSRKVESEVRAFAFNLTAPRARDLIPRDPSDLKWAAVHWPEREAEFAALMRDMDAPNEPDPAIAAAWSGTSFLKAEPHPGTLVGPLFAPAHYLPFRKDTTL